MVGILTYLQYALGKLFYKVRGHDTKQIVYSEAFKDTLNSNMTLESVDCGPPGSMLKPPFTCLAEDKLGKFPALRWAAPENIAADIKEYVLICEDIDLPIPGLVIHHGLFYGIPPTTTSAGHADIKEHEDTPNARITRAGWRYIPNMAGNSYMGPAPPLGHGTHRYVFTIIALNEQLHFDRPEQVNKKKVRDALVGKVIGWGQWYGVWERPWPKY